jgi:hypothetical protein
MHANRTNLTDPQRSVRELAVGFNNRAWDLVEASERTRAEVDEMLDCAHASRALWRLAVGNEGPVEILRAHQLVACANARANLGAPAIEAASLAVAHERNHREGVTEFDHLMTLTANLLASFQQPGFPHVMEMQEAIGRLDPEVHNAEIEVLCKLLPWPRARVLAFTRPRMTPVPA